jgi:TonB family protein
MKKQILLIVSIFLFSLQIVSAQTPRTSIKQVSGGVLNGKAEILAKPAYPAAARAVNAEGAVSVQVLVDEEGTVVSADAVSGHPLLREAARAAALESKFKPTTISGQIVKVSGVIVYNFLAGKPEQMNWFKVGYDLQSVQHATTLVFLNSNSIAKNFPADWTTENEQLQKLSEIKQAESSKISQPMVTSEGKISETKETRPDGTTVKTVITKQAVKFDFQPDSDQIAISQTLIASLRGRLADNELNLWQFNAGSNLSQAMTQIPSFNERQRFTDSLRKQIEAAPREVSPEYLAELQKVVEILEKPNLLAADHQQIGQIMPKLFRNQ